MGVITTAAFETTNHDVIKCIGGTVEMFSYRKARRMVLNATQVFTKAFLQPPPSLTNVQAAAAMTYGGVDHILRLASEVVMHGIKVLGTL